jgi:hypothetical protein
MKQLLIDAKSEILALRRKNEILQAKVEVMDLFSLVLHTRPAYSEHGAVVDVAWQLQKEIQEIETQEALKQKEI